MNSPATPTPATSPAPSASPTAKLEVVLITGMSGSGKSVALHALEDAGYYSVDNLPPELLASCIEVELGHKVGKIAVAMDVRSAKSLPLLPAQFKTLRAQGVVLKVFFLDSTTEVLVHRFSETRRRHPLSNNRETDLRRALTDAIETERELLGELRNDAHVIDTSLIRATQLQSYLKALIEEPTDQLTLVFESFGFKRGIPLDADYVFDVRMLPNPHYEPELKALTGRDAAVVDFLQSRQEVRQMLTDIEQFVSRWLPHLSKDHRSYVTVAIGCTGGQHRSVYLVEALARHFAKSYSTLKRHREMDGSIFASSVL
jgi:RNase adapter protein RapZ